MTHKREIILSEDVFAKITTLKKNMGFDNEEWDDWFVELLQQISYEEKPLSTIELIFKKNVYDRYYDNWIKNFSKNLEKIWNGKSIRSLMKGEPSSTPSLVIGRGPSLFSNNHLKLLANSNFDGNIICTDGVLIKALEAGVIPEKFRNFFVVTIDSQDHIAELYNHELVKTYGNKIKCILSTTIPEPTYDVVQKNNMNIYWIHALFDYDKGKTSFNYIANTMIKSKNHERGIPAIQTGGNVGTSCWMIAWSILKSSTIVLLGIDHGYPNDMDWNEIDKYHKIPSDVNKNSEAFKKAYPIIYNPDFDCYCKQDPIFQYYSNALKEFIPRAPSWVNTINATGGGAIFGNRINCMDFSKFLKENNY